MITIGSGIGVSFARGGYKFLPSTIPDIVMWFDASDPFTITHTGGSVSQWNDKSSTGAHCTQTTGSLQPVTGTRTLNGKNALEWDGSAALTCNPTILNGGSGVTIFMAAKSDVIPSTDRTLFQFSGNSYIAARRNSTTGNLYGVHKNINADSFKFSTGSVDVGATNPFISVTSNRNGGSAREYYSGSAEIAITGMSANNNNFASAAIGAVSSAGTQSFIGLIGEVIVYKRELSYAEKNIIGAYLASKWGASWINL